MEACLSLGFKPSTREDKMQREDGDDERIHDWSELIPEILELISDLLPLMDFISFRAVCRGWRLAPSGRSEVANFSKDKPWFLFCGLTDGKCNLYSASHPKCCTFYCPDLQGATVMHSKFGWVIAHRGEHCFLYNCFTLTKINLPNHVLSPDQACTFTTIPTCSDCTVFIVTRKCDSALELSSCRISDSKWEVETLGISKVQVGDIMFGVYCCSCSFDYSHCDCGLGNNRIGIFGCKGYSTYIYTEKTVAHYALPEKEEEEEGTNWRQEAIDQHGKDWLQIFGVKRMRISLCTHSLKTDAHLGWHRVRLDVAGDHENDDDERGILNAARIDPKFGKCVS